VPLALGERRCEKYLNNLRRFGGGVHPSADPHHLGVVVFPGEPGGLGAPRQGGPAAANLVRGDLLAVARPADHHAETARVGDHSTRGLDAERRVVVVRVEDLGADVHHVVPETGQVLHQKGLELETSVIATKVDAHRVQHCHMTGRWIELADGVLVRRYAELDLSVGLVIGDHSALVVDTRSDPAQGAELRAAVREITRQPCTVVLTHAHFDHCLGTAAFLPAPVWAHPRCRDNLARGGAAQHAEALACASAQRIPRDPVLVPPVVPDHLVTEPVQVDLGGHRVLLTHPGLGHTEGDIAVWSPDTGVLFAGDLVEQGADPDFTDAYPLDWPTAVTELLRLGPRIVVPGHGEAVDASFAAAQRDDLATLAYLCRAVLAGRHDTAGVLRASPFSPPATLAALARLHPPRSGPPG
jgi:glyoxylase-like metal-dependent hydrolase (beta-lactamase superfamily II)